MDREPRPMATVPDFTISRIPKGSRLVSSASSFAWVPVASMTTASGTTDSASATLGTAPVA